MTNTTTTLLDDTTKEVLRIAHIVVAEACQSDADLRSCTLVQRGRDFRCRIGDRAEVVIRFRSAGTATRIVVEVIEAPATGLRRVRRRRVPSIAEAFADVVESAIDTLDSAARRVAVDVAA